MITKQTQRLILILAAALLPMAWIPSRAARPEAALSSAGWSRAERILERIVSPRFPDRDFKVTQYGAAPDDGADDRDAIHAAIKACTETGGGRVLIPGGTFLSEGPINLDDNVNLHLQAGARLQFGSNPEDYLPVVFTRWEGTECYNYSPMIYTRGKENLAITGQGLIDGGAQASFAQWKPQQDDAQDRLRQMGNDGVPVEERVFGEGDWLRPSMIQFLECQNVLLEGVEIRDSPFWVVHPVYCTNVTVRGIRVHSGNKNNDGVDPDSSRDVLIEECVFQTGDDNVAIKSGRDQDAWRVDRPSENIIIRNCLLSSEANGLCIGSEMSGGVRNVFMENCTIGEADHALYFKSNLDRGGFVENVWIRNIALLEAGEAMVYFTTDYHGYRGNHYPPSFRNFLIENIACQNAGEEAFYIVGHEDASISNIIVRNVSAMCAEKPLQMKYAQNVRFENVVVGGERLDGQSRP